ncbi:MULTISPECIES: ABC transporter substrate-binding protein [unclassified Arthrobacter]|uniref:ABC transporter substrate-binding protein n=1 Tax=unclassified Arthrobacter TaxID=235627 RepID=UPI001490C472|nr:MULTISPECIES: extracellular solute-binding protein [unclassified Arthrobacter]MBE0010614.1 extracellular solute-binding protein [Arthrobacter sp. AET 35A]NOJ58747.1 extracellular solute-binding protein [Arthrobacter sp. 260]NOJ64371.1 extracellular solute-binding protein [Arthrobacter sp. 147(2020)]
MKNLSTRIRTATAVTMVAGLSLSLAACGGSGGSEGDGNLRFSWWGSDPRHAVNEQIIEDYTAANEDVTIEGEFSDFSGYWDRLATTTAGRDAPDVITMDEKYLQEYAGRGALADLSELPNIDLSKFDEATLDLGRFEDGLYGLSTGRNALTVVVNADLFAEAGVEIPDDTTWTWDDYYRVSKEVSENLDGVSGSDYGNSADGSLRVWLRQQGESLYNETNDGVGYTPESAEAWFEHLIKVRDEAGGASPAEWTEAQAGTFEGQSFPTNKTAMSWYWSNQLEVLRTSSGSDIRMLRAPSMTGNEADNGMYYKASMYWSISSQSENQDAAADFVNYLANNEEPAKKMLVDRGVPVNPDMAAAVRPELGEADQAVVDFLEEIEPNVATSPAPSPVGAGGVQDVILRYDSEVLFGDMTPAEAAEQMTAEIEGLIQG